MSQESTGLHDAWEKFERIARDSAKSAFTLDQLRMAWAAGASAGVRLTVTHLASSNPHAIPMMHTEINLMIFPETKH